MNSEKKDEKRGKGKQAWLRIVEAFISVLLVMSVMLVVISRNQPATSPSEEIGKLQRYTLDYVVMDDLLRSQVLGGYLGGVNDKVKTIIPANYNYSLKICNYTDICSLGFTVPGEVYSDETPIFANLTYYDQTNAKKLKLFFWKGSYPDGVTPHNYSEGAPVCTHVCAGKVCGSDGCGGICGTCTGSDVCTDGVCVAQVFQPVITISYSNLKKNYGAQPACSYPTDDWYYYDMSVSETGGHVGATFGSRLRCFYWTGADLLPKQSCDALKTTMPAGMPSSIAAGQTINVPNRWFCVGIGYTYNVTETYFSDSAGTNFLVGYNVTNVD